MYGDKGGIPVELQLPVSFVQLLYFPSFIVGVFALVFSRVEVLFILKWSKAGLLTFLGFLCIEIISCFNYY